MTAHWTLKALRRLRQIHDYIAEDQPRKRFVDRLTRKAGLIALQPLMGRIVPEYQREEIRETFEGDYRIVYRVLPGRIDILTVRHGARRMPPELRQL